jgi:hypothetical protein
MSQIMSQGQGFEEGEVPSELERAYSVTVNQIIDDETDSKLCVIVSISKMLVKMITNALYTHGIPATTQHSPCNKFYTYYTIHSTTTFVNLRNLLHNPDCFNKKEEVIKLLMFLFFCKIYILTRRSYGPSIPYDVVKVLVEFLYRINDGETLRRTIIETLFEDQIDSETGLRVINSYLEFIDKIVKRCIRFIKIVKRLRYHIFQFDDADIVTLDMPSLLTILSIIRRECLKKKNQCGFFLVSKDSDVGHFFLLTKVKIFKKQTGKIDLDESFIECKESYGVNSSVRASTILSNTRFYVPIEEGKVKLSIRGFFLLLKDNIYKEFMLSFFHTEVDIGSNSRELTLLENLKSIQRLVYVNETFSSEETKQEDEEAWLEDELRLPSLPPSPTSTASNNSQSQASDSGRGTKKRERSVSQSPSGKRRKGSAGGFKRTKKRRKRLMSLE